MSRSTVYEERKIALHLLRSGCSVQKVAQQLNRSVSWVYKWQTRFEQESWLGLQGRSCRPHHHGRCIAPQMRQAILHIRSELEAEAWAGNRLKYIGAPVIRDRLHQKELTPLPSLRTIERVLRAGGMLPGPPTAAAPPIVYPHLQPTQAHQLIQVDIVPHYLTGGEAVACFNAIDVVSRYPTGQAFSQRRAQDAVAFLIHVWQEIGLAQYTPVDNEGCFSGGFTHKGVLGQVLRLALWVGTELVFSPMYHPESNGSVERFHQDYNHHVWHNTVLQNVVQVNEQGTTFFDQYRLSRHHSALKGQTPTAVHQHHRPTYLPSDFKLPSGKLPLTVGRVHFMRRVSAAGTVSVLNVVWDVPQANPSKGVWVTLDFIPASATLGIYDAPPDAKSRTCLVTYPFPLSEKVQPQQTTKIHPEQVPLPATSSLLQLPLEIVTSSCYTVTKLATNFFRS